MHYMRLNFDGYMAAKYSQDLSSKVFLGCVKIARQGFRPGGPPPYGLHRLLLDEKHNPVLILKPGQRKNIQNQRVTLAPGDEHEQEAIRTILDSFGSFAQENLSFIPARSPHDV